MTRLDGPAFAELLKNTDVLVLVLVFAAGAGGKGGPTAIDATDGAGLLTTIEAAKLADVRRLVLVSVFPKARRWLEASDTFEHYTDVNKKADTELVSSDLDWIILRPAALTDTAGTGRISLSRSLVHTNITRDYVAAVLAEFVHTADIQRQILELAQGSDLISEAVHRQIRD